ncbi:MAG TPA: sirohydrochlorin nickelochelatase [Methanobacterium sp.]|nr:sirohydrochlorin nickelochelatase [Methanobacterium sp.]
MVTNSNSKNKIGVLLISHGSRLPYGEQVINELADIYREKTEYPVVVSYMNMSEPSIPVAVNQLSEEGVNKIIAIPVFLAHGVHTTNDIPKILNINDENGHEKHSHENSGHVHGHSHSHGEESIKIKFKGEIIYTEPLGADRRIVNIIEDRVNDAL